MQSPTNPKTELVVVLDFPSIAPARKVVQDLKGLDVIFKVGSELFLAAGPDYVRELVQEGKRIFLDLKFHDIPNTVTKAAHQAATLGVEMFTLHLSGGEQMIRQVRKDLDALQNSSGMKLPKVLGVSVLTSFDEAHWNHLLHQFTGNRHQKPVTVSTSVLGLVEAGVISGVDGIVCSAEELNGIRSRFPNLYTVVPGIRPKGSDPGDQARVVTPKEAKDRGAHAIVVGRPITQSRDARGVTEAILQELK